MGLLGIRDDLGPVAGEPHVDPYDPQSFLQANSMILGQALGSHAAAHGIVGDYSGPSHVNTRVVSWDEHLVSHGMA